MSVTEYCCFCLVSKHLPLQKLMFKIVFVDEPRTPQLLFL